MTRSVSSTRGTFVSGKLICPIPTCPSPEFWVHGGSIRHHFAHRRLEGSEHSREQLLHLAAKSMLASWAKQHDPSSDVRLESRLENGRTPDVLIILADGSRHAIEVQYSAITESE